MSTQSQQLRNQRLLESHANGWHERPVISCSECPGVPRLPVGNVTREPFRPSQRQTALTEEYAGIRIDLEYCCLCGAVRGVGDHHLQFRSAGGTEGPTIPACLNCHDKVHDRRWFMELTEDGLFVNNAEGELIWRLLRRNIDASEYASALEGAAFAVAQMHTIAPTLLSWEAGGVFDELKALGESAWKGQVRLAEELLLYRMPHLKWAERIHALAERFGIRKSQAYNLAQVAQSFPVSNALDDPLADTPLTMGTVLEATRSTDPEKWLHHAEVRKLAHPQYSREDLRQEVTRAGERKQPVTESAESVAPKMVWVKCLHGVAGWAEKLPVGAGMEENDD